MTSQPFLPASSSTKSSPPSSLSIPTTQPTSGQTCAFDFSQFIHQGGENLGLALYDEHHILEDDESMVFQVPGWETWDVADIGRMRVYEEMIKERQLTDISFERPDGELEDYWEFHYKGLLQDMEGRRTVSDEVLEGRLKAEKLDPVTFWLSKADNEWFPYH